MHLLHFEIAEHNQRLSRLEEVTSTERLLRIIACLQEGCGHLIRFVPNKIQDHNARCFLDIRHSVLSSRFVRFRVAQARGTPTRSLNRGRAAAPRNRLDVTKEMGPSPLFPIRRIVRSDTRTRTQHAEEGMLTGINHNPSMSAPDGQVARLRLCYSPKFVDPHIKVRRARVFIRPTGALIDSVDKVGAVESKLRTMAGIQRDIQNPQTL